MLCFTGSATKRLFQLLLLLVQTRILTEYHHLLHRPSYAVNTNPCLGLFAMLSPYLTEPSTNTEALMGAQVFAFYGTSVVIRRFGTSTLGQDYCIFTRKRLLGGYQTHMITANSRTKPFISGPFKVSAIQVLDEAKEFVDRMMSLMTSPKMFSLGEQPEGMTIPVGKAMMQLTEVDPDVHNYPGKYLLKGDEIYVECILSGITFYHSGIYADHGSVYHFMSQSQEMDSSLVSALSTFAPTPAAVTIDQWDDFVYALMDRNGTPPRVFRVTHPLLCRSPQQIINKCEELMNEWEFYDIRNRNCQHFSSLCSTGAMVSYDMGSQLKYIACTIMRPSGLLAAQRLQW